MGRGRALTAFAALWVAGCIGGTHPEAPVEPLPHQPPGADWTAFDRRFLHHVAIEVAPEHLEALAGEFDRRVPCTLTLNGVRIENVGIRQKGWRGSLSSLDQKPSFSVKFDEFVEGQTYRGLDKLLLNNSLQDPSLLNEPIAYALHERAGLPAPRTTIALVYFNRRPAGFYVVREAFDGRFLKRAFGDKRGNLYEGPCCVDFAAPLGSPDALELKDEDDPTRQDLRALAAVLETAGDPGLPGELARVLDLDAFLRYYALEAALAHWDGFSFNLNNYYLYRRDSDGRFVFLPHGMDQLLDRMGLDPLSEPRSLLSRRIRAHPALDERFRAELERTVAQVWDPIEVERWAAEVKALVQAAPRADPRVAEAIGAFEAAHAVQLERYRERRRLLLGPQ